MPLNQTCEGRLKLEAVVPVILCGGEGSRLWPLSRPDYPKQFHSLGLEASLLSLTLARICSKGGPCTEGPIFLSATTHRRIVADQIAESGISRATVVLEPVGRNTAPALTIAALISLNDFGEPVMVVTPSDHRVDDTPAFVAALTIAVREARQGRVILMGVKPQTADSGFGYIICDKDQVKDFSLARILDFIEKPMEQDAEQLHAREDTFWNVGVFVMKASLWLDLIGKFRPDIFSFAKESVVGGINDFVGGTKFFSPEQRSFLACPSESIDRAVIEHCSDCSGLFWMIPLDFGWYDLGSWQAVWASLEKDGEGNVSIGRAVTVDCKNTLAYSTGRNLALLGVNDIVVVETAHSVLVLNKSQSQHLKTALVKLSGAEAAGPELYRKVYRPWGWYQCTDISDGFKVKRIQVNPCSSLSLQLHAHRSEHWVVVRGEAEISVGEATFKLTENQSTFIPPHTKHRLRNPHSTATLEIIEVQTGAYLSEDDIVRLDDDYGRVQLKNPREVL